MIEVSIYLLSESVKPDEVIDASAAAATFQSGDDALYLFASAAKTPDWLSMLDAVWSNIDHSKFAQRHCGAVAIVHRAGRVFALTFGTGHLKLHRDKLVADFGRKVVISAAIPDSLSQISRQALEGN